MNHFALNGVISPQELYYYALRAVAMLIVIPFHESAHALISWKLGDSTAKDMGRLSMNPLRHFDPLGALCMIAAGVGWAKPVGINPTRFKNPKRGMAVSAAAGPLSNFLLAYAAMLLYKVVYYACGGVAPQLVLDFLYVLPNTTEAALLLGDPMPGVTGEAELHTAQAQAQRLTRICPRVLITGVAAGRGIACVGADRATGESLVRTPMVPKSFHGTGDIFGAVLVGRLLQGNVLPAAAQAAAVFVADCLKATPDEADERLGVWLESVLPRLMQNPE